MKKTLLLVLCVFGLYLSATPNDDSFSAGFPRERIMNLLTNKDVCWAGEYPGLVPYLSPNAEAILRTRDSATAQTLKGWLTDPNRFVVAHVLLTLSGERGQYQVSASEWNTLRVRITDKGDGQYDLAQMKTLQQEWMTPKEVSPPSQH